VLDAALLGLLDGMVDAPVAEPPADVVWAWRRLISSGGNLAVGELARELGWSRRRFGEHFRREIGLPPKVAGRVIRFGRVCSLLRSEPRPSLADAAVEAGYFDQAHLARDFRDLAGISATAWLAENDSGGRLPSVQDTELVATAR
jgi:AraC-like DNA-binding protein